MLRILYLLFEILLDSEQLHILNNYSYAYFIYASSYKYFTGNHMLCQYIYIF